MRRVPICTPPRARAAEPAAHALRSSMSARGAGHLSFALAPLAARVVALDPSPGMLATVRAAAAARGLAQIETCDGSAAALPFADASFDLVCTRYSAHHWLNLPQALAQLRRVVQTGRLRADHRSARRRGCPRRHPPAEHRAAARYLACPGPQCRRMADPAGGRRIRPCASTASGPRAWSSRPGCSGCALRRPWSRPSVTLQAGAPPKCSHALSIEADGSFTPRTGLFWGRPHPDRCRIAPNAKTCDSRCDNR